MGAGPRYSGAIEAQRWHRRLAPAQNAACTFRGEGGGNAHLQSAVQGVVLGLRHTENMAQSPSLDRLCHGVRPLFEKGIPEISNRRLVRTGSRDHQD